MEDFPAWVIVTHFLNIVWMSLLARSGLEILSAFPKLYWKDGCPPGHEWLRFTRKVFRADSPTLWSSLEEEESWSPVIALPGRKNLGLGRHWHFLTMQFWILTGATYLGFLFASGYWHTLVPTRWEIFPEAARDIATYLSLHLPAHQPGSRFNAIQQLSYFAVVFILAPLQIATGAAMSPAVTARFPWYTKLFGGRQSARTVHFLGMCAFGLFIVVHVTMVVIHGLPREFAAMMLGSYRADTTLALILGLIGLAGIIVLNIAVTCFSLRHRRTTQRALGAFVDPMERSLSTACTSRQRFDVDDISTFHRVNGYPPPEAAYQQLRAEDFTGYRLQVGGLVRRPLLLSLDDLRALGWHTQITRHTCIQGWTAIAEWAGVPLARVLQSTEPTTQARYVVFHAFDDKAITENEGRSGYFYGTIPLALAWHPQTILALEMNGQPLPVAHGAPIRLRVENQLGFKMVKWIRSIELVHDYQHVGQGQGGWREDQQYYTTHAGI